MANLRSYGPGKFDTILDSILWGKTLEGISDDEFGESESFGYFVLMSGGFEWFLKLPEAKELTFDELDFLSDQAGAILSEDSNGFVNVDYYEDPTELDDAWSELEDEYSDFMNEEI